MRYTGAPSEPLTAEQFAALPDDSADALELVRGRVVREPPPAAEHGLLAARLCVRLGGFVERSGLGAVLAGTGFLLATGPDTVRAPDLAFVATSRIPAAGLRGGYWRLAPDLAVEIRSPSNSPLEIQEKVLEYLQAGTRMVWVVDPERRAVVVYRSAHAVRTVPAGGSLEGEDVVPGFSLPLAELFG